MSAMLCNNCPHPHTMQQPGSILDMSAELLVNYMSQSRREPIVP